MFGVIAAGAAVSGCFGFFAHRSFRFRMRQERYGKFMASGQGAALLPELRQLVKRHPGDLMLRYFQGQAFLQAGLFREAAQELELVDTRNRTEKLVPPVELAGILARAYEELGRYKEAQGVLLLQLKSCPLAFELLVQVAEIFQRRGMPRHASDYMEMALRIDPDNAALILRMSAFLEHSGDLKGALTQAKRVLELRENDPEACRIAARVYFSLSNYPRAMEYYAILAGLEEHRVNGLKGKAECLYAQGWMERSLMAFEEALRAAGDDRTARIPVLYRIGEICIKEGEIVRGLVCLEEVEQSSPGYKDTAKILARYRDFKNDRSLSVYAFSREGQFRELTAGILTALGVTFHKHKTVKKLDLVYYAAKETKDGPEHIYFYFSRKLVPLDERELREIVGEIRVVRMKQGVVYCPGGFTPQALEYARSRPLSLIGREELSSILKVAGTVGEAALSV